MHQGSILNAKFHPFQRNLAINISNKTLKYWQLDSFYQVFILKKTPLKIFKQIFETKPDATVINKLCFSENGYYLFTASNDFLKVFSIY